MDSDLYKVENSVFYFIEENFWGFREKAKLALSSLLHQLQPMFLEPMAYSYTSKSSSSKLEAFHANVSLSELFPLPETLYFPVTS
jgi:hypothetical protein